MGWSRFERRSSQVSFSPILITRQAKNYRPDHFIVVSKMTAGSIVENLHIRNWPTHLFSISSSSNLTMRGMLLDNRAGDAPNFRSGGLPAAHNSDGFDVSTTNDSVIYNNIVYNQDDCVAITSGNNITVHNFYCSGGHGMSIGSVGGKSNNNVTNILVGILFSFRVDNVLTSLKFTESVIVNSQNGARIKSNYNTTGFISNITYSNIVVSNISIYGIDVQQDYLNGGPVSLMRSTLHSTTLTETRPESLQMESPSQISCSRILRGLQQLELKIIMFSAAMGVVVTLTLKECTSQEVQILVRVTSHPADARVESKEGVNSSPQDNEGRLRRPRYCSR